MAAITSLVLASHAQALEPQPLTIQKPDGKAVTIKAEIATDEATRNQGLMFRTELPKKTGMLFVYDQPGRPNFWMKNTLIPLDMLFFNKNGMLVHVHPKAKPKDLTPIDPKRSDICAVLELAGGEAARLKLEKGDKLIADFPCTAH